jgi:hypothetical protein
MHFRPEDTTDLIEIQSPGSDCLLIILPVEISNDRKLFTPLDDVPLDLGHNPTIVGSVSELSRVCVADLTHVVNFSIALRVSWVS